jgi:DNA-directed RNA polymerase specialized sigma24 family protein
MVELARHKLEGAKRAAADEEDVALSAFKSFCLGAQNGKFTRLEDRTNLWPLLVAITVNKSIDLIKHENRRKRGGSGRAEEDRVPSAELLPAQLSEIISNEPTPEFVAEVADQVDVLLRRLDATGDEDLSRIALRKMEGFSNTEISAEIGCVRRTVERKLQLIERLWAKDAE